MITNEFYLYLQEIEKPKGVFKEFKLHYLLKLDGYKTVKWEASKNTILPPNPTNEESEFTWNGKPDLEEEDKITHTIILRVSSTQTENNIKEDGFIIIKDIKSRSFTDWKQIRLRMQILDEDGDPIGGEGSVVHYGDAD